MGRTGRTPRVLHPPRPFARHGHRTGADGRRSVYTTDTEPDRTLLIRCGNRRASVCPSCSYEYAGDMWQFLYAGAAGGRKGVPDSIRAHPLVFATLTAPGFGPVHTTRTDRRGGPGRCRPPRGKPTLCQHGRSTWCTAIHDEADHRLGQPICADCYDYAAHVAFNWHAPELWRRFTITLRRTLAHRAGLTTTTFAKRCRVSFVKVAEYQRRAVVHFHALVRLDAPGDDFEPCDLPLGAVDLAHAIREAASLVRLVVDLPTGSVTVPAQSSPLRVGQDQHHHRENPVSGGIRPPTIVNDRNNHAATHPRGVDEPKNHGSSGIARPGPTPRQAAPCTATHTGSIRRPERIVLRFGTQTDTQAINGGPAGELTPERVAAYIAKYATKSADDFGVGDRRISLGALPLLGLSPHVTRIIETCWALGEHQSYEGLRRWLH
ncbi:MAG TPA: replication initiator, partial [Mycobacteriales bacterium]